MEEPNKEQDPNNQEIQNIKTDNLSLLSKIFYSSQNDPTLLTPILKSTDELPHLFYLLKNTENIRFW